MLELWVLLSYLGLGIFVGFFAGLLGIGGGAIMVPILTSLFIAQNFDPQLIVHMALGTSMASILFTSISSVRAHHKHQAVIWPIVKSMTLGIVLGTVLTTFIVSYIPTLYLTIIFSILLTLISLQMWLNIKPKPSRKIPNLFYTSIIAYLIGGVSALIAIGGGSLTVPFLTRCNISIKKAIATSSAVGFTIAFSGAIAYGYTGLNTDNTPQNSWGFIYWPAVLCISSMSIMTAPIGAKWAHKLPVNTLKKVFAILLFILSIKMITTI